VPTPLPPSSKQPFAVPAAGPVRARGLFVHGYSGTPYEVRPLADALARMGVSAAAPLLPGHGVDPLDLNRTDPRAWYDVVDDAFAALPADAPRVLVGCSMGGLLMIDLAARRKNDVAALVLLAPALVFHPQGALGIAASRAGLWRVRPTIPKETPGGDVEDEDAKRLNPTYPVLPVKGLRALDSVRRRAWRSLPSVRAPICVVHGALDGTIAPSSAAVIVRRSGAPLVEAHLLPKTRHLIGLDVERDVVASLVASFLERALGDVVAAPRAAAVGA
jgi:carboxylesterase